MYARAKQLKMYYQWLPQAAPGAAELAVAVQNNQFANDHMNSRRGHEIFPTRHAIPVRRFTQFAVRL
jgi:hypothetical protein